MIKIIIDPSVKISYSSFYIKGIEEIFGKNNVTFSSKYFKQLLRKQESHSYDHYMAFVILENLQLTKIIIDFRDKVSIKESAYEWCDIYAKVNFNKYLTKACFHDKIVSITPGFGIKIWGLWKTLYYCFSNLLKCSFSPLVSFKSYFIDYLLVYYKFANINTYYCINTYKNNNFVFFISTLWPHKNCIEETNIFRKKFIDSCKSNKNIHFQGGLFASYLHPQYSENKEVIFSTKYTKKQYIYKTLSSIFVFNTPAVHNCHGWKLGEYLAMGKAIISMPLSNELPEKLIHGINIHFINDISEIDKAIDVLLNNNNYRLQLASGSKMYYNKFCSPKSVIENILKKKLLAEFSGRKE